MGTSASNSTSSNNGVSTKYLNDVAKWKSELHLATEEIDFLESFLSSDIFEPSLPNLFEKLQLFLNKLESFRNSKEKLDVAIEELAQFNNKDSISLYRAHHIKLRKQQRYFVERFSDFKIDIYNSTIDLLKKS
ncbi:hypothetical protein L1I30_13620 [Gillisia sp. M10.2A]|uniref:Uncharacterized protein n=1 Tax=Gillisia lutea TaxID=2909668 RepID=A0ABS9EIN8_9FLAO|nr:hypothetical protein [Gillisia lutea]MCF4102711.1 hypothetical protein [Gillisia lutea]